MSGHGVKDRPDAYSKVQGRKFVIPFWKDEFKDYVPGGKRGTIQQQSITANFRPSDADIDVAWEIIAVSPGGDDVLLSEQLPNTPEVKTILESVKKYEKMLNDDAITGKGKWVARGEIDQMVENLKSIMRRT